VSSSQSADVDARFNYWGGAREEDLEVMIFDRMDVPYLGRVIYNPPGTQPFTLEEAAGRGPTGWQ
jgi:hypothetical protein